MKGKNAGLIELSQYISNCGVTERDPVSLMHQYLASSAAVASDWGRLYSCVGNDLQSHVFLAGSRNPGLAPKAGKTVADSYQGKRRNPEVWVGLFSGAAFGQCAKGTHLYSQFSSALGPIESRLREDQKVMLFHMMGAPNIDMLLSDTVVGLRQTLSTKEQAYVSASLKNLAADLKVDASIRPGLADNITLDIAAAIKDCRYPVLDGQTWATIRDYVAPPRMLVHGNGNAAAQPVPPGIILQQPVAAPLKREPWTDEAEDKFVQDTFWRTFKRNNGLSVYHPAKEAIHLYFSGAGRGTVEQFDHAMMVNSILPYCDISAVATDTVLAQFKQDMYERTGENQHQFEKNWPAERLVKAFLIAANPTTAFPLERRFVERLLPLNQ